MINAMVYAAGLGTRMGELTKDRPKPMIDVAGRPLLDHAMSAIDVPQVSKVILNTHYKRDAIEGHDFSRPVSISYEETLLETGGGLKNALPMITSETVLTANSDSVWRGPNPAGVLLEHWESDMDALLLLIPKMCAVGHKGTGDFDRTREGLLRRGSAYVYSGLQLIKTAPFAEVEDTVFSTNVVWDHLLASDRLRGVAYPGQWCDVGYPEAIPLAELMLANEA